MGEAKSARRVSWNFLEKSLGGKPSFICAWPGAALDVEVKTAAGHVRRENGLRSNDSESPLHPCWLLCSPIDLLMLYPLACCWWWLTWKAETETTDRSVRLSGHETPP
jgi:hypothetical protein